jgi:hypothetical protein
MLPTKPTVRDPLGQHALAGYGGPVEQEAGRMVRRPLPTRWYRIPNGLGTIGGKRHDPKKHGTSPALGTINRA